MKQYLAFRGDTYYPGKGMEDFIGDYEFLDEAIAELDKLVDPEMPSLKWRVIWDSWTKEDVINEYEPDE